MLAFSCKKEGAQKKITSEEDSTAFPVNFSLAGFDVQTGAQTTNSLNSINALKGQIKYLHYAVYGGSLSNEKYAHQVRKQLVQKSDNPEFGLNSDTLYSKRYGIYFVGSQSLGALGPSEIHGSGGSYVTHPIYVPKASSFRFSFADT